MVALDCCYYHFKLRQSPSFQFNWNNSMCVNQIMGQKDHWSYIDQYSQNHLRADKNCWADIWVGIANHSEMIKTVQLCHKMSC